MPSVHAGGVEVGYEVQGEGEPLVLVHGSTTSSTCWAQLAPLLAGRHRLVLVDYEGSGSTPWRGAPLSLDDLAAQVLGAASHAGAERFHVAGWSLGSVVATAVAAGAPERVRSLTAVCGWVRTDARMRFTFDLWRRLLAADPQLFMRYAYADGMSREVFELVGVDAVESLVEPGAASIAPGADAQVELDQRIDLTDRLASITAPTLVVGGALDRWVDVVHSRELAAGIAGARLVELEGVGHLVPQERADQLAGLLLELTGTA